MTPEEAALRAERMRLGVEAGGTYVHAVAEVNDEVASRLTEDEWARLREQDDHDLALYAAIFELTQVLRQVEWFALEELLPYLGPGERPWEAYERTSVGQRRYLLQLLLASGWWVPGAEEVS